MKTITTRDRVILEKDEVQQILKEYIEGKLTRKIDGAIIFQGENNGAYSAHAHLVDEPKNSCTTVVFPSECIPVIS